MGSLFKSKTEQVQAPFESNPWRPQQQYLKEGFSKGLGALNGALDQSGQIKDFTADLNPGQLDAIGALTATGMNTAQGVGNQMMTQGGATVGNVAQSGQAAQDFYARAGTDRTGQIIDRAGQYADNPYLQTQIDGAISDVNRGFQESRGQINAGATGTGNINSTRAGALEAISMDDAMDRAATITSGMRSSAYENGMNRSIGQDMQQTSDLLVGQQALGQTGAQGAGLLGSGLATQQEGYTGALGAQSMLQSQAQGEIDGLRDMSREDLDLIQRYMGLVGGNYGSNGFQTQINQSASPFQQIAGAVIGGMGAMKGFG
jgi:hypothetical protein